MKRYTLILTCLLTISLGVKSQPDSTVVDTVVARIELLLKEYNSNVFYVDTSDYEAFGYDSGDMNLLIASSMGACNEIVRLVSKGADVNTTLGGNASPLHYAIASGRKEAVEILLLLGAVPDKYDPYGRTPLITAVLSQHLEMSEILIRYGAPISQADLNNSTALHHAAALGNFYLADLLLYYDSPVDLYDIEGNTPLMAAVGFGYYDITDILIKQGADPNIPDRKMFTPLMTAAQNGDTLMMRMLINSGANMYAFNNDGFDALGCAVRVGMKDAVTFLLETGKMWSYTIPGVKSPSEIAEEYGHKELLPLLASHGFTKEKPFRLEEFSFTLGSMFTTHYLMLNGTLALIEPRKNAGIILGCAINPFGWRLLVEEQDAIYQYRVNSTVIHAGIFKEFPFNNTSGKGEFSFTTSLSGAYRFYSNYEGTRKSPEDRFCIMPSVNLNWNVKHFGLSMGVTYLKTPFYKVMPLWFGVGGSVTLFSDYARSSGKKIRLYKYE
ncbi:MAG: ankyrin repeat domain-containing protein [Bacteroidales bacterium]|nr:ankyrin repeat domain-containing protein [Bacteroidales bacterium]